MATPVSPKITDHTTQAQDRLPGWQQNSALVKAFIRAITGEVQPLEDVADGLVRDTKDEIPDCPCDPVIAPGGILLGHC